MKQESKEYATQAFQEMDQDRDGKVTKEEFISACLAQVSGNVSAKLALGIVDVFVPCDNNWDNLILFFVDVNCLATFTQCKERCPFDSPTVP